MFITTYAGALSDDAVWRLSDVCLSVAYIGPKSRIERPRKTKIGTEVADVTRDSDTTFKVKSSKVKVTGAGHIVAASRTACYYYYKMALSRVHTSADLQNITINHTPGNKHPPMRRTRGTPPNHNPNPTLTLTVT